MNFKISVWTVDDFDLNINDRGIIEGVPYQCLL